MSSQLLTSNTLAAGIAKISSTATNPVMGMYAYYWLQGGGQMQAIGTNAITLGDIGNLVSDMFAVDYPAAGASPPSNVDGTGAECPAGLGQSNSCLGGLTPMVDTGRVAKGQQPTGASTPFRTLSGPIPTTAKNFPATPASGGLVAGVSSFDTPGWNWALTHLTTLNSWGSTSGTVSFREFAVAYSSTFPRTYAALNFANWTITVVGSNNGLIWTNTGTALTNDPSLQQLGGAAVQVLGNSYATQNAMAYKP